MTVFKINIQTIKSFVQRRLWLVLTCSALVLMIGVTIGYGVVRNASGDKDKTATEATGEDGLGDGAQQKKNGGSKQSTPKTESPKEVEKPKPAAPAAGSGSTNAGGAASGGSSSGGSTGGGSTGPTGPKKNCIVKPSACGYPDSTNTGYKHTGVTLNTSGITINGDGDFIIDQDNTVIDSKRIDGCVIVRAKNVTIRRSLITNCQSFYNIWMQELPGGGIRDTSNFLMEDVEVDGNRQFTNAALVDDNGKGMVVRRMDMHDVADGPHPGENWLIEDSYIHDMYVCPNDCHTDSIQSAGAINVIIRHNSVLNNPDNNGTGGKNAVVRIATEQDPVSGFIVDNNLMDGGNYAVQVRSQGHGAPTGVVVTNNRIVPTWRFAPYDFTGISVVLTGNYRDDTLEPLNTPM